MVVRNVYSAEEKEIVADFEERAVAYAGWVGDEPGVGNTYPVFHGTVPKEQVLLWNRGEDWWNPMYTDERYARNTRWGGLIAAPLFENWVCHGPGAIGLRIPASVGRSKIWPIGQEWHFFKPIRPGDTLRAWRARPRIEDITTLDGKGPRRFKDNLEVKFINQKDELVSVKSQSTEWTIFPPSQAKKEMTEPEIINDYRYSKEELALIERMAGEEEIRGAKIRYWEDVKANETLKPTVLGPTTIWDSVLTISGIGLGLIPMREVRRRTPDVTLLDPITGITRKTIECHLADRVGQMEYFNKVRVMLVQSQKELCRLVTNWMGDDGFITVFDWRRLQHRKMGDSFFHRGKVIKKYVKDGEHLVDLSVWAESIRGNVTDAAFITVSLLSKESI